MSYIMETQHIYKGYTKHIYEFNDAGEIIDVRLVEVYVDEAEANHEIVDKDGKYLRDPYYADGFTVEELLSQPARENDMHDKMYQARKKFEEEGKIFPT